MTKTKTLLLGFFATVQIFSGSDDGDPSRHQNTMMKNVKIAIPCHSGVANVFL